MTGFHPPIHEPPERVSLTCPLGLRFVDVATNAFVGADVTIEPLKRESLGLDAEASPVGVPQCKTTGVVTPSGIIAFHGLPGLRRFENFQGDDPWGSPHPTRDFQIEVKDRMGRFLPCTFTVTAPKEGLAVFADDGSPPWIEAGAVPLFSAPARAVPAGLAVVRAQLRELGADKPAAWALMEADYFSGGSRKIARGMADDEGRVVLMFAYPEGQRRAFNGSPPGNNGGLSDQKWTLRFNFQYQSALKPEKMADYALRLTQAPAVAFYSGSPMEELHDQPLSFGRELNLKILDLAPA